MSRFDFQQHNTDETMNESTGADGYPRAFVKSLTFNDGTVIDLNPDDIVVIVGPNNMGKSATLREIEQKVAFPQTETIVLKELKIDRIGSPTGLSKWLERTCRTQIDRNRPLNPTFVRMGQSIVHSQATNFWDQASEGLRNLTPFFFYRLTTEARLSAAKPAPNIRLTTDALSHPIHYMQFDDSVELRISNLFQQAFGQDLIVHRNAGNEVPLHCGVRPSVDPGEDRVSVNYLRKLEELPTLDSQGDGMKAFVGILLHAFLVEHSCVLIDEPEAFLHPPQARLLARFLVEQELASRQIFLATHSGDILRGILDAGSKRVRVIRIQREGDKNVVAQLQQSEIEQLWNDPLLRYSNVLDGIFHHQVVACESDGDCRFYSAIRDAMVEKGELLNSDVMFVNSGGKDRLPTLVNALRRLNVKVAVIADFDSLNSDLIGKIHQSLGGDWESAKGDWRITKAAIEQKRPELQAAELKERIGEVLESVTDQYFPRDAVKEISGLLRKSTAWSTAKDQGMSFVPSGDATKACQRLMEKLKSSQLHVVQVGELEGWCRSVGGHGPAWVIAVIEKNLATDPELEGARSFVKAIFRK
jgi:ABC-type transporter Mla maintaining outer membrane lipid asymmetry ATPase subunit MlaF